MRQAGLRAEIGAADVDAHHQVVTLHRRLQCAREADGTGVVHQDIYAAKLPHSLFDRGVHLVVKANVQGDGQGVSAGGFNLFRGGIDGAGQPGIGLGSFAGHDDVGAVTRGAQRNRQADAAAGAGDE